MGKKRAGTDPKADAGELRQAASAAA